MKPFQQSKANPGSADLPLTVLQSGVSLISALFRHNPHPERSKGAATMVTADACPPGPASGPRVAHQPSRPATGECEPGPTASLPRRQRSSFSHRVWTRRDGFTLSGSRGA